MQTDQETITVRYSSAGRVSLNDALHAALSHLSIESVKFQLRQLRQSKRAQQYGVGNTLDRFNGVPKRTYAADAKQWEIIEKLLRDERTDLNEPACLAIRNGFLDRATSVAAPVQQEGLELRLVRSNGLEFQTTRHNGTLWVFMPSFAKALALANITVTDALYRMGTKHWQHIYGPDVLGKYRKLTALRLAGLPELLDDLSAHSRCDNDLLKRLKATLAKDITQCWSLPASATPPQPALSRQPEAQPQPKNSTPVGLKLGVDDLTDFMTKAANAISAARTALLALGMPAEKVQDKLRTVFGTTLPPEQAALLL